MKEFLKGFEKRAVDKSEKHYLRRGFLSSPVSAAIEAKKGKKWQAAKETSVHLLKHMGVGAAGGAALGGAAAALSRGKVHPGIGALAGANLGSNVGGLTGTFGRKASELHGKYSKNKE